MFQAIRKGQGDAWFVNKLSKNDIGALHFCKGIILAKLDNIIECGKDMFEKVGYAGILSIDHWCTTAFDKLKMTYYYYY